MPASASIASLDVPVFIYHLGDYDPSGVNAGEKIEQSLREMAPRAEIHFERLAVTPLQILAWSLPTRPTKASDSRSKGFGSFQLELVAIAPQQLREVVQRAIERHLPPAMYEIVKTVEASEKALLGRLVGMIRNAS
jgi:hypothetical protein